jgi:hypothetical protein
MKTAIAVALIALSGSMFVSAGAFNSPVKLSYIASEEVHYYEVSCADGVNYEIVRNANQWCINGAEASQCETKKMDAAIKACRTGKYIVDATKLAEKASHVAVVR